MFVACPAGSLWLSCIANVDAGNGLIGACSGLALLANKFPENAESDKLMAVKLSEGD